MLCYIMLCGIIFYNLPQYRASGDAVISETGIEPFQRVHRGPPVSPDASWSLDVLSKLYFYLQKLGTSMGLEQLFNSLNKYLWVYSILTLPL